MEPSHQEDGGHFLRLSNSSIALGTSMAWIGMADRDKLIEDVLDCSINVKLPAHRRGFPGTQWREGCEQRKYRFDCAPSSLT